jgi:hypothetical protein
LCIIVVIIRIVGVAIIIGRVTVARTITVVIGRVTIGAIDILRGSIVIVRIVSITVVIGRSTIIKIESIIIRIIIWNRRYTKSRIF